MTSGALIVLAVTGALTIDAARSNLRGAFPFADLAETIEQFTATALQHGLHEPVEIGFTGDPLSAGGVHAGLVNQLDRHGVDVVAPAALWPQFGTHRVATTDVGDLLLLRVEPVTTPPPPGAEVLAVHDPMTPVEHTETDALTSRLTNFLEDGRTGRQGAAAATPDANQLLLDHQPAVGASTRAALDRLTELRQAGDRLVLYYLQR